MNEIGKKVWLLDYNGNLTNKKIFTIKDKKKPSNDYCYHYIVEAEEGYSAEVREFSVVFVKDESLEKYLADNECYGDVNENNNVVSVNIEWGDWKHSHLWLEQLMKYIGYTQIEEYITEECGSDCYSSTHLFVKQLSLAR